MQFSNPIWVASHIDDGKFYKDFTKRFAELMNGTKKGGQITIFFNSGGGCTRTSLGIYDLLQSCGRNTVGIVAGIAYSCASLILQACKRRLMTTNSSLMLHSSSVKIGGVVENAQAALDQLRALDERFYEIYASRSGAQAAKIADMAHRDKYFDPREALDAGLIDDILV